MIRIAISRKAYKAIRRTLPDGMSPNAPQRTASGDYWVWLSRQTADRLASYRGQGESYSDVILRLSR